jgi:lipopolysaccharide biosynthesis glycosyltransferase
MPEEVLSVYIGYDGREAQAYRVAEYTLRKQTKAPIVVFPLKHKALRQQGIFDRPWTIEGTTGNYYDRRDGKPFSTEFAFTRFLVPHLQGYEGWALFVDSDVVFRADVEELFALRDEKYAVQVVKHDFFPAEKEKMDGCVQQKYWRKNWSSVILFNCGHEYNRKLSPAVVNSWPGSWLHSFSWLKDEHIGSIPAEWNFLVGHTKDVRYPKIIHYTDGGPWFDHMKNVPYASIWISEYHAMLRHVGDLHEGWEEFQGERFNE